MTPSRFRPGRVALRALPLILAVGLTGLAPVPEAVARGGTESLADLAAGVLDAVVNISASQVVEQKHADAAPNLPPGTPYGDLFEEFFKRQLEGRNKDSTLDDTPHARRSSSLGSGFVIDPAGIVVTNNHVIEGANEIIVILSDGRRLKADVVGKDAKIDVAVLKVTPTEPLKAVRFGDSDKMRVGDAVMAIGNPYGFGGTVTAGIVSGRNRNINSGPYDNYIQTDASINRGNSGGPLFNMAGEVIGINTAILSPSGGSIGIGFATPADTVLPVIDQLREFHEARRGWLGVRIQPVDDAIAESLGLGAARGALVAGVDDRGPAKPAGMKAGDIILDFDGRAVKESRDLPAIVAATPVGKDVKVTLFRDKQNVTVSVKLGRLDDTEKVAAADPKPDTAPPAAVTTALGMSLAMLSDNLRKQFAIKDTIKGVVVTAVQPDSPAGQKGIKPGDVIAEVNQQQVAAPADVALQIKAIQDGGRKTVLLLVSNGQGEVRFVAIAVS